MEQSVLDAIGQPMKKRKITSGEVWEWHYVEARTSKGTVFLLFASETKTEERQTVNVEFNADGVVRRTWRE